MKKGILANPELTLQEELNLPTNKDSWIKEKQIFIKGEQENSTSMEMRLMNEFDEVEVEK